MLLLNGDCIEQMQKLIDDGVQVDSVVTDPPYHLQSIVDRYGKEGSAPAKDRDGLYQRQSRGFMGKEWDGGDIAFRKETWELAHKLLKPGGHLLAFSASRNYHRMAVAIEDAGFEIRDQIMWIYGSGFPKSLNIGKQIDKRRGNNGLIRSWLKSLGDRDELAKAAQVTPRQIDHYIGENTPCPQMLTYERFILICDYFKNYPDWSDTMFPKVGKKIGEKTHSRSGGNDYAKVVGSKSNQKIEDINELATDEAKQYEGWGTALKPAHEPIVMARKPLSESSIVGNILKHGTGGINIDECRVSLDGEKPPSGSAKRVYKNNEYTEEKIYGDNKTTPDTGRFPSNVMHDGSDVITKEFPHTKSGKDVNPTNNGVSGFFGNEMDYYSKDANYGDEGSAARFFYCPKVSKSERNQGLEHFSTVDRTPRGNNQGTRVCVDCGLTDNGTNDHSECSGKFEYKLCNPTKNTHPTVKPIELMKYLCRLVTPKGGTILDPFMGSGSTGMAAKDEGFEFIGIEQDKEYFEIAESRITRFAPLMDFM